MNRPNSYISIDAEEEIVISGIAGRFPNSDNLKEFQENLFNKVDLGSSDHGRWNNSYNMPHRIGKVNNIEKFDSEFFNVPATEAHVMDPMTRMLLEHTYEAIIDAGVNPKELRGTRTSVFTAISVSETRSYFSFKPQFATLSMTGCNVSFMANRICYWLGVTGQSHNIDTACSSSSYAVVKAYELIRSGDCDAAIIASANLCLHPHIQFQFYHLGVLSSDGYCKPYDEEGTGYMRSDTVAVVYLQKAKNARRIYATFVHGKTNCDGFKEEGITFPSFEKQKLLLENFYEECEISPNELSYVEAHTTGTLAGDPVEVMSIDQAICAKRNTPLLMGSVKSNLGHSEAASGLCQIAKVLLTMEIGIILPTIHFKRPRKELTAIIEGRIKIITEPTKWEGGSIGVNSFGFGGANCHILLKSNPKQKINNGVPNDDLPRLVAVSGRTEEAVKIIFDDMRSRSIDTEFISLLHHIHNHNIEGHLYRGYMITGSKISHNVISKIGHSQYIRRPICFIFSGLGSQCFGISRALIKFPVFAKAIQKCDIILKPYGILLTNILTSNNKNIFDNIINFLMGLIGLQIGLVDLLTSIGIVPDFIIGHSIGELICGYADGCLTAEETILSAYFIGLALHESKIINGSMAEINLNLETLKVMCPSDIDIACYNSFSNFIVSGPTNSIRAFLNKLQADNISVKRIPCGNIPFHSRYIKPAVAKSEIYLNQILPQKRFRSSKWLTTSTHEYSNTSLCSKYYTNYLLSSVLFAEAIRSIPKDTVTIEISPENILQHILNNYLCPTVTNVALYERTEDLNGEVFLESIGKLYNAGLQPQISNLYPTVEFPVSRGTPMISPLIRWDHSENYYVFRYTHQKVIFKKEIVINIDVADETFIYLTGHVIDGKNLFPAMGYLFFLWEMLASLNKQDYTNVPIVFEDVNFIRATVLSQQNEIELTFSIQEGINRFEITEGDNAVVTGILRIPTNIENEKISANLAECVDDEEEMSTKDIYKELRLRGYQYAGVFRGLKSASVSGSNAHIAWKSNWVAFMDSMLQMMILGQNSRSLFVPTRIRKLTIDPKYHVQLIQNYPVEERQFSVRHYKSVDAIISGGIEICGIVATPIFRRQKAVNAVLEEYKFVAHRDLETMSLQDAIRMSTHIALECYNNINVKIIEFIGDNDQVTSEDLNSPFVNEILSDLPQIRHHIWLVTSHERYENISLPNNVSTTEITMLSRDENCLMVIGFDILTKNGKKLHKQLLPLLMPQGFILTLEKSGTIDYSYLKTYELDIIVEKQINEKTLLLLKKTQNIAKKQYQIMHVSNYDFSWIDELKSIMSVQNETSIDTRIILVAQGDFECGLLGFINCLRKEPGGEIIRSVFIQDNKAPGFSLQEPLYMKQLQLDLPINVLRSGNVWGSYRHFPLPSLKPKLVDSAYVKQTVQGDLSTLCWVQKRMSSYIKREDFVNVIYAPLNFKDIMLATGRITAESIGLFERSYLDSPIGLEFVGFDTRGRRIMGMCLNGGMTNICVPDEYLSWNVPDEWTMEDAATVPCVYITCYDALYIKGKMKKGDKILIHSGTGGIGQAAIHLALHEGCEVFTTVGTVEKRQFMKETFPSIPEDHIGNSRDTSFEQMIIQRTGGRGVDIVLNSLAEEKLQASVRCLANGGRFLEIGKFDMISNNSLDMSIFSKGISFHGVLLDKLLINSSSLERKITLSKKIAEGLKNGAIKPLCRKVFNKNEIETAFRYMAAGKHIGKIIIKVHQEEESLDAPLLAYPRYYCMDHKSYVILGGLGGFGLELADWLTFRGAKNLVLTSRTGIRTGYQQSRVKLWRSYGVDVQIVTIDNTLKHEDCESILKFAEEKAPVDAIFNLAVVLKDCTFQNQSPQTFEDSFKSKAWMTKKMDELSRTICPQLRHFVVFSSVSCGRGNAGQTNYGMANSVMERICEKRTEEGLHGLAIQWGAIGDVGLVADMQEENKELVIGGTLQQRISSCLDTLEVFLLQDRPVVSSMVVAEKTKIGGSMNISETVAHIMGLKNINTVPPNVPLVEMGMDSMMAVEIKQTLEREFDISLTAQDIRTLNFAKLKQITITGIQEKIHNTNKIGEDFDVLIRKTKDADFVPDILVEFITKKEVDRGNIFLLPGIEGCSSVYKTMASGIKFSATCLQHGVLNIPDDSHSVMKSAAYLLPHILKKMKDQRKFLIVGYSFGSLIAIELARLLEAKDFSGRLILIDGAPDQMKILVNQYFHCASLEELRSTVLLGLLGMYATINKETLALELNKCNTDEKLKVFHAYFPKDLNVLTIENQKLIYFTIYNHIVAVQDYDISSLPRLKSSITLLKPTFPIASFTEEDYGLHKVTEGKVQIHYVEGNHITMMDNDKIISAINEEWIEDNKIEDKIIQ